MMSPEVMAKKELCKKINLLLTPEEREKWDQAFVLSYVHHTTAIDGNRIDERMESGQFLWTAWFLPIPLLWTWKSFKMQKNLSNLSNF